MHKSFVVSALHSCSTMYLLAIGIGEHKGVAFPPLRVRQLVLVLSVPFLALILLIR